jgi:hypothetical protein
MGHPKRTTMHDYSFPQKGCDNWKKYEAEKTPLLNFRRISLILYVFYKLFCNSHNTTHN